MAGLPRALVLLLALALPGGTAYAAERNRERDLDLGYGKRKAPPVERAKPCEGQGPGFRAAGASSCLRVFGGVRVDSGSGRNFR